MPALWRAAKLVDTRDETATARTLRLLYSVRTPADVYYADELHGCDGVDVTLLYTRAAPDGEARAAPHRPRRHASGG